MMKFTKNLRWVLIGGLLVGSIFASGLNPLWPDRTDASEKEITQRKKDLKDIKKKITVTKQKEKEIQGQEISILESLSQIDAELYQKGKELKGAEEQLAQTKEKLRQTRYRISELNKGMEQTKEDFFARLIALYKMGRISPKTFLFASHSYSDLLRANKYLRVIVDSDARLVDTYRSQVGLQERYQGALMEDQTQWERSVSDVGKKKEEIQKGKAAKRALLKSIQNQKVVYHKVVTELEERARELQAFIDKLEREKAVTPYEKSKPEGVAKGKLAPPVQGSIISLFREKGQNGIEIKAPLGAEVHAVLPGKVLYADWFKGFGNVMIIDHGNQTFTVSGYCSQLLKKAGEIVAQGEVVALVGSAGSLKGPCLYFEIRHKGKPQDPRAWVSRLDKTVSLSEGDEKERKEL